MNVSEIVAQLESMQSPKNIDGMARFGIRPARPLGISMTTLRPLAKALGRNHDLAAELWLTGYHEARLLASLVDDPTAVTEDQMNVWVDDFDSWDLCDQCCGNLFDRTEYFETKAYEWAAADAEFTRRAGFVVMAEAAVHRKAIDDAVFVRFLPTLQAAMVDDRNFVKKAVSWSFRQIGKRSEFLHAAVTQQCGPLIESKDRTERWIAKDVMKELGLRFPPSR